MPSQVGHYKIRRMLTRFPHTSRCFPTCGAASHIEPALFTRNTIRHKIARLHSATPAPAASPTALPTRRHSQTTAAANSPAADRAYRRYLYSISTKQKDDAPCAPPSILKHAKHAPTEELKTGDLDFPPPFCRSLYFGVADNTRRPPEI